MYQRMKEMGIKPDFSTYHSMFLLYTENSRIEEANELSNEVMDLGLMPAFTAFTNILNSYSLLGIIIFDCQ